MALWGLMEPMAPENYWTGMVESSSIPGSQEPESCYTHSFFKGQRIKLPEISSCQAGAAGAQVCGCPSPDTTRWLSWRHKASLHIPSQVLPQRDWPAACPHVVFPCYDCRKVHSSFVGYLSLLFGNVFIVHYLHYPTTCTIPLFLFPCFCIQCLPVSVKWMLNEEWEAKNHFVIPIVLCFFHYISPAHARSNLSVWFMPFYSKEVWFSLFVDWFNN